MTDIAFDNQPKYPTWVIKIGGSLLGAPELANWLAVIVQQGRGNVIVVPGGSVFADAVREAQKRTGIADADAHHLAIKAMDQFGLLMAAMHRSLVTVRNESEMKVAALQKQAMVWLPSDMLMADGAVPCNWDTTSDSLSAWLASRLSAAHLILVKSAPLTKYRIKRGQTNHVMVEQLMNDALVDGGLVDFIAGQPYQTWVMHKADADYFNAAFEVTTLEKHGLLVHSNTY